LINLNASSQVLNKGESNLAIAPPDIFKIVLGTTLSCKSFCPPKISAGCSPANGSTINQPTLQHSCPRDILNFTIQPVLKHLFPRIKIKIR